MILLPSTILILWLDQNNSAAVLIESTPSSFSFVSEAGVHKKGGGVAILFPV